MLSANGHWIELNHYPDGTLLLKPEVIKNQDVTILWSYENDEETLALVYITRFYQDKNCTVSLYVPYYPNARMDRVKDDNDVFTLKYFTEVINSLNFKEVHVCDVHSNVSLALINHVVNDNPIIHMRSAINEIMKLTSADEDILLYFPDEGAGKRYSDSLKMPYAYGNKNRNWQDGKIKGITVIDNGQRIENRTILIIDDICSKGGTFYHSAKKLKELGAGKIYLYITHCENSILTGDLIESNLIEKVFTTNSIFTKQHNLIQIVG